MKCPKCSYNQPAKQGLECSKCNYHFCFDPKSSGLTDGKFLWAIRTASQNDTAFFTRNQLYAAYCRNLRKPIAPTILGCVLAAIILLVAFTNAIVWLAAIGIGLGGISLMSRLTPPSSIPYDTFMILIDQWHTSGRKIERLIDGPSLHDPPPEWNEADIYDYGVEQILIVQRDELVDLLVLNGAHAEHRALIISETGYPEYLMPHAQRLLDERQDLPIYLLHDADRTGLSMGTRLSNLNLPLQGRKLIDLGMNADSFKKLKRTRQFDPKRRHRDLPVDALSTAFLVTGLAACFATETTLASLLEEQAREAALANSTSSFG